ncbi:FAD-binding oxidoreductase [Pseudoalteromonas obscura]|uniref:FAD-dependent oxidoreductase n=1 Tax=Pseudoalteromonas obscura TaxID=3048491 RepID=A0ABT7EFQ1_9GAMM|nr:FAD-dependent oxidoreductase [Pseudoalteromonas sp. P94(2023)]MDK2593928.1 FAD-dependent oxidoreductase [Pseudoalteromonas sp. P94(2023)]
MTMFLTASQKDNIQTIVGCDSVFFPSADLNNQEDQYNQSRKVFNRKFDFVPSAVVQVTNTVQVAHLVAYAEQEGIGFTVKSGGHDHEGECVSTAKVLIDFCRMNEVNVFENKKFVSIQPGAKFKKIKTELDKSHLGIPHGTCQTVAIAGYTMGGGWGPWTRKYGMGCEHLVGATMVLGDGTIAFLGQSATVHREKITKNGLKVIFNDDLNSPLLRALRGGGGLSYGIVTEFIFEPFELPDIAQSFVIKKSDIPAFDNLKATDVIAAWESLTSAGKNPNLIGTNLKVNAKGVACESEVTPNAVLDWQLNGHFGGTSEELERMLKQWGGDIIGLIQQDPTLSDDAKKQQIDDLTKELTQFYNKVCSNSVLYSRSANTSGYTLSFEAWDRELNGIELETDEPAPHKITSRMPTRDWGHQSRIALVKSLQSTLLYRDKEDTNISAYITLGAISGEYYGSKPADAALHKVRCTFPYQDRPFTIQYQAWWDQPEKDHPVEKEIMTRFYENRAQDWIESCRSYDIPHTKGSFISFKDAAVETKDYFGDSYNELIDTKCHYSKDAKCLFRSRKTII